jgi:hypothetical protein
VPTARALPWYAAAVALTVAACGGSSGSLSTPSPTPTATATSPAVPLTRDAFLGVHFLRPTRWTGHRVTSSAHAGNVNFVAPGRRGTLYLEANDCAACVDQGLIKHGRRNGVSDPDNAVAAYQPTSKHRVSSTAETFTTTAMKPYAATGKLIVTRSHGDLTGYVVIIVTLPTTDNATTQQILASLQVS